jgi:hypothetical protein
MSIGRRVEEYSQLIARAFNGAITVNGQRIVAHPSGTLIVRGNEQRAHTSSARTLDPENDWSNV